MKNIKTNASRILDLNKIKYELITYEVDENDLSATHVAQTLGEAPERVFKTLILKGDKTGHLVCIIPAEGQLDMKQVAKITGNKSCEMVAMKNLLNLTGYIRGGCSPIGMKKIFPTYIDLSSQKFDYIYISGGKRGLQIKIAPSDLCRLMNIKAEELVEQ